MNRGRSLVPVLLVVLLFATSIGAYFVWARFDVPRDPREERPRDGADPLVVRPGSTRKPTPAPDPAPAPGPVEVPPEESPTVGESVPDPVAPAPEGQEDPEPPPVDPGPGPSGEPGLIEILAEAREAEAARDPERALAAYERAAAIESTPEIEAAIRRVRIEIRARAMEAANRREFEASMAEGEAFEGSGDLPAAIQAYERALGALAATDAALRARADRAIQRAQAELRERLDARDFETWLTKAREALAGGRWAEADAAFREARAYGRLSAEDEADAARALRSRLLDGMVRIEGGEFVTGSSTHAADDGPLRRVRVETFYIDAHEVTNETYAQFVEETGHAPPPSWKGRSYPEGEGDHPVCGVSWHDATAFAGWAGKRLPTELEWERAARGTDGRSFPWGDEYVQGRCNALSDGARGPRPVGSFPEGVSPAGCHDMAGNVLEWTSTERIEDGSIYKVMKGGSWLFEGRNCRASKRFKDLAESTMRSNGFRCAR